MDIIKGIKEVADVVRKADNIDLYRQILDLQKEALDLVEENNNLRKEITKMKEDKDIHDSLIVKDNFYFKEVDESAEGPFCTACWDQNNKLIRLNVIKPYSDMHYTSCPVCNTQLDIDTKLID